MIFTHISRTVLVALLGLLLAGCGLLDAFYEPTHRYTIEADVPDGPSDAADAAMLDESVEVIQQRIEQAGGMLHGHSTTRGGKIVLETSHIESEQLAQIISIKGELEFLKVDENALPSDTLMGYAKPGSKILPMSQQGWDDIAVKRLGGIDGRRVERASAGHDSLMNEPVVFIEFDQEGSRQFAQFSRDNVGKQFAIVIDDVVLSAPFINEPILGGQAQINGNFTLDDASALASVLTSGALPVTYTLTEVALIE